MTPDWTGRTALVTGGSAGLGAAIARELNRRGARVALVARNEGPLADAAASLTGAVTIAADLNEPGQASRVVREAASRLGRLDLVCHAAGRSMRGLAVQTPLAEYQSLLRLNCLAAVEIAQAAAPLLCSARGSLVLIGSLSSRVAPPYMGAYAVSKFPLAALAQQLRLELGPQGMHTLLVCPGPIARADAGSRYNTASASPDNNPNTIGSVPDSAKLPGAGARVRATDPAWLAEKIVSACDARRSELVVPRKARILFALGQLFPDWGDWLLKRLMRK